MNYGLFWRESVVGATHVDHACVGKLLWTTNSNTEQDAGIDSVRISDSTDTAAKFMFIQNCTEYTSQIFVSCPQMQQLNMFLIDASNESKHF